MQMEGVGGLRGWQWIFVLEGILTCIVAIGAWFVILDFPDKAAQHGFLNEAEANFVLRRIEEDRGDSEADPLTLAKSLKHLSDPKLWAFCTLFMSTTLPVYAFSYFTPVILVGMGKYLFSYRYRYPVSFASILYVGTNYLPNSEQAARSVLYYENLLTQDHRLQRWPRKRSLGPSRHCCHDNRLRLRLHWR